MSDTVIRQAISTDIAQLAAIDHSYSTDHVWQMILAGEPGDVNVAFREVRLPRAMRVNYPRDPQRLIDEWTKRSAVLMAETEGEACGYVALIPATAPGAQWVSDMAVGLRHRRQGVGTRLVGAAIEWARAREFSRLFVEMQSKNFPAIMLVRKLGFVFSGYSDHYYPDEDISLFFSIDLS
ncbi:MAG TPA: GNAT family N-acetyltransferase [Anaerolineales bacterium]|nr:GNAT family N-acetyltransferase [Anaerolineales bacterium]